MGGFISLGFRYKDRADQKIKTVFMQHWTNDVSQRFMHKDFIDCGDAFYEFIAEGEPEHKMYDELYCRRVDKLEQTEYGFILVDFVNKKAYSANEYCRAFKLNYDRLTLYLEEEDSVKKNILELADLGWLSPIQSIDYSCSGGAKYSTNTSSKDFIKNFNSSKLAWRIWIDDDVMKVETSDDLTIKAARKWMKENGW